MSANEKAGTVGATQVAQAANPGNKPVEVRWSTTECKRRAGPTRQSPAPPKAPFAWSTFVRRCLHHGVKPVFRTEGHWQAIGLFTVNWYPLSKSRSAYVNGAVVGVHNAHIADVLKMAKGEAGTFAEKKESRQDNKTRRRRLIKRRGPFCHWCKEKFDKKELTVDHVIPLSKGGSNRDDNLVLACKPCNGYRGNDPRKLQNMQATP